MEGVLILKNNIKSLVNVTFQMYCFSKMREILKCPLDFSYLKSPNLFRHKPTGIAIRHFINTKCIPKREEMRVHVKTYQTVI